MSKKDKKEAAKELLCSPRGGLILSRALNFLLQRLKSIEGPLREEGDIADIELLLNGLLGGIEDPRIHLDQPIYKGKPTKNDRPGILGLIKGGQELRVMADCYQVLSRIGSDWVLTLPLDSGADPRALTPQEARQWLFTTGPANAKLVKKYFPN
jgi:hypothetical protein